MDSDPREELERLRPKAFATAYRMLGSVSEAEDVVQEALLRLHREVEGGTRIESPDAFVVTVVTRLSIDQLRSARVQRETYVGDWLPEPILTPEGDDPARHAEIADSLSTALLVLLETLSPEERAVFILREVFEYDYPRIAEVLGKSPAATRKLGSRARGRIEQGEPRFETSQAQQDRLADRFFDAFEEGNLEELEALLAEDVVVRADGGGKAPALGKPVQGRVRAARAMGGFSRILKRVGARLERVRVNGGPGVMVRDPDGRVLSVTTLEIAEGRIVGVHGIANPDKLEHLGPVGDAKALVAKARKRPRG